MIKRILVSTIIENEKSGFVNVVYGPRRVGKTVLLEQILKEIGAKKEETIWFNGDTAEARDSLSKTSEVELVGLVGKFKYVIVDEAQRIENIGLSLKILVDKFPKKKFFVSGSSSLILSRGIKEPLTGRNLKYCLYPLSVEELGRDLPDFQKKAQLESQLLYGGYPYLLQLSKGNEKEDYLRSVVSDYLFRDVLMLSDIGFPETLNKLAILLAFQIGSEVSLNELAVNLGIEVKTVKRYLSLLKQSFVIFEVGAFSGNLRKEVVKSKKYYFWDLGIRNALINQFMPLDSRIDKGLLWENFLAVERFKRHEYQKENTSCYFWRTWDQAEVDWVEKWGDKLRAYEFKFKRGSDVRTPKSFLEAYKEKVELVSLDNYLDFVM